MRLDKGYQESVVKVDSPVSGKKNGAIVTEGDTILTALFVEELVGELDVKCYAITRPGHRVLLYSYPTITAPTPELLLKSTPLTTVNVLVETVWTGQAKFELYGRAVDGGTTEAKIITSDFILTDQQTVNTTPTTLVAASLEDGIAFEVTNWSSNGAVLYISTDIAKTTEAEGYPIPAGASRSISVKAGQTWYVVSSKNGADLRIMEAVKNA